MMASCNFCTSTEYNPWHNNHSSHLRAAHSICGPPGHHHTPPRGYAERRGRVGDSLYEFDDRGLMTKQVDALGNVTAYTYDGNDNRPYTYDSLGNLT